MNSKYYIHIIIWFVCLSLNPTATASNAPEYIDIQTSQDSLYIDTSVVTPRQFENIKDKYSGDNFIYERTIETSGWWTRFKQWIKDLVKDLFNIQNETRANSILSWSKWIGGTIVFLLVVYFIFRAVMNKEGSWVFGKSSDKNVIPVKDIEVNIHATDFNALIKDAESNNNYRLAIRYYYLWLLKSLTLAEIIEYDVEKTNSDYQNEISSKNTKEEFSYTSYLYNYIWYGEFDVNQQQFSKAKQAFMNFLKTIKA